MSLTRNSAKNHWRGVDYNGGMTYDEYLDLLKADSAALLRAAEHHLDAQVPACPGWTVTELLAHLGAVQYSVSEIVRTNADRPLSRKDVPPAPEGDAILGWFADANDRVVSALEQAHPDSRAWNWGPEPHLTSFWYRRMAQETAVHRWDVEHAAGQASPIDTGLAVDGVDELLDMVVPRAKAVGPFEGSSTVHLHATDTDGEWLLTMAGDRVEVSRGHAKGDAAVRGPASQLLLLLWQRVGADADGLEIFGDPSVVEQWAEKVRL